MTETAGDGYVAMKVWRGDAATGAFHEYRVKKDEGMVVLDVVHRIQAEQQPDLACRWNCKAGKCGSCSAEVNGVPRLMCMTRLSSYKEGETLTVAPMRSFPVIKDLVTDVHWNYEADKRIPPFTPKAMSPEEAARGEFRMAQRDIDRVQEFRKCIECYLCQDVCHVLRDAGEKSVFMGPRFMIRIAGLEMHPKDSKDRVPMARHEAGIGACNITKCCTEVCPERIRITDNGIIPMKERVADRYYDPLTMAWRALTGGKE